MPYEKEEDERSENQNRPWAGRGYDDYYICVESYIIAIFSVSTSIHASRRNINLHCANDTVPSIGFPKNKIQVKLN